MVNYGILIHKKDVDDHNVTVANPQHGSIGSNREIAIAIESEAGDSLT